MFVHCSSSLPSSKALTSVIYHGDQWKTNQNMWVSWSTLVNNSEQWVCAQWSTEHRKTQQSLFKHHQMWFAVTSWNYMSEENIHNSIIRPFLLLANKDITWLFAGRCSWVFFTRRSKPSASITNIKQAEIRERCLTGRINLHKRDKERHDTWLCASTITYTYRSGKVYRDNITEMFMGCSAFLGPKSISCFSSFLLSRSRLAPGLVLVPWPKPQLQTSQALFQLLTLTGDLPINLATVPA